MTGSSVARHEAIRSAGDQVSRDPVDILRKAVERLQEEKEALRQEIAALKCGDEMPTVYALAFPRHPVRRAIIWELMKAQGALMPARLAALSGAAYHSVEDPGRNIGALVNRSRTLLPTGAKIELIRDAGYIMPPASKELVQRYLGTLSSEG